MATTNIQKFAGDVEVGGTVTGNGSGLTALNGSQVTSGTVAAARIANLDASKITTGTFGSADRIPNLPASKITSGTLGTDRIPDLDASKITSGTITQSVDTTGDVRGASLWTDRYVRHEGDGDTYMDFSDLDTYRIVNAGSETFRINSSGYVGLSLSNPSYPLHFRDFKFTTDSRLWIGELANNTNLFFDIYKPGPESNGQTRFYIGNTGAFGLERAGAADNPGIFSRFSSGQSSWTYRRYNNFWIVGFDGNNNFQFVYQGAGRAWVSRGQNVGQLDFTGQHRCIIKDLPVKEYANKEGLIVTADTNTYIQLTDEETNTPVTGNKAIEISQSLPVVSISKKAYDRKCYGVISGTEDPESFNRQYSVGAFTTSMKKSGGDTRAFINSVGEGAVWVTNLNGTLESGDYITTSNVAGYGMKQDDDILHNYSVAKVTMDCDFNPQLQYVKKPLQELKTVSKWYSQRKNEIDLEEYSNTLPENQMTEIQYTYKHSNNDSIITKEEYEEMSDQEKAVYELIEKTLYFSVTYEEIDKYEEDAIEKEVDEYVNILDSDGNIQWVDTEETELAYDIRYLTSDGTETDESNAYCKAAFVGCTYHCG